MSYYDVSCRDPICATVGCCSGCERLLIADGMDFFLLQSVVLVVGPSPFTHHVAFLTLFRLCMRKDDLWQGSPIQAQTVPFSHYNKRRPGGGQDGRQTCNACRAIVVQAIVRKRAAKSTIQRDNLHELSRSGWYAFTRFIWYVPIKQRPEYVISGPSGVATSALSEIGETLGNLQIHSFFFKKIQ